MIDSQISDDIKELKDIIHRMPSPYFISEEIEKVLKELKSIKKIILNLDQKVNAIDYNTRQRR